MQVLLNLAELKDYARIESPKPPMVTAKICLALSIGLVRFTLWAIEKLVFTNAI